MIKSLNTIKAEAQKSKFTGAEHLCIMIDGISLDQIMEHSYPGQNYFGLVPALLDWLDNKDERDFVWNNIAKTGKVVPILMCPDDCDFWCTLIVVEIFIKEDQVTWQRIGLDNSEDKGYFPHKCGRRVEWFDKIGPMTFSLSQYLECLGTFRNALS